jgi:hypothetical protein
MNAYRYEQTYEQALRRLQECGAIEVESGTGTRRQWLVLVKVPRQYKAIRPKPKTRKHKPDSRGQSLWSQELSGEQREKLKKELAIMLRKLGICVHRRYGSRKHRLVALSLAR